MTNTPTLFPTPTIVDDAVNLRRVLPAWEYKELSAYYIKTLQREALMTGGSR
jgi:hypothetical protein